MPDNAFADMFYDLKMTLTSIAIILPIFIWWRSHNKGGKDGYMPGVVQRPIPAPDRIPAQGVHKSTIIL